MTHLWLWYCLTKYNKDDTATLFIDPLLLFFTVYYLYLGISSLPPLLDMSYMARFRQNTDTFYLGMPLALIGMLAVYAGCRLAGFNGLNAATLSKMRKSVLDFTVRRRSRIAVIAIALFGIIWILRFYMISEGYYSIYTYRDQSLVSGWRSIAIYFPKTLQYFMIPISMYVYVGTKNKLMAAMMLAIIGLEFINGFTTSQRTLILTLMVQIAAVNSLLKRIRPKKALLAFGSIILLFFTLVQPVIYAYRVVIGEIAKKGDDFSMAIWGEIWKETAESISTGRAAEKTDDWAERDLKYRLAAQGYLSVLAKAIFLDGQSPPYGEFTLKNVASIVPSLLWPEKGKHTVGLMKAETPKYYKIQQADYKQTLTAHFLSDGGIAGVVLGMTVFGIYLGLLSRFFILGMTGFPVRAIMAMFLIPALFFDGVGDFRDYFIMPWREGLAVYLTILFILRRKKART